MTKNQLIEKVAKKSHLTKRAAADAVPAHGLPHVNRGEEPEEDGRNLEHGVLGHHVGEYDGGHGDAGNGGTDPQEARLPGRRPALHGGAHVGVGDAFRRKRRG